MSKQSEAKAAQGYTTELHNCGNCGRLEFDLLPPAWMRAEVADGGRYTAADLDRYAIESHHRCGLGGFAVKKTATCNQWLAKDKAQA